MKDAFEEFAWNVAPSYAWKPWLDRVGNPVVPSSGFFRGLEREVAVSEQ
jgi:hypothetical protein